MNASSSSSVNSFGAAVRRICDNEANLPSSEVKLSLNKACKLLIGFIYFGYNSQIIKKHLNFSVGVIHNFYKKYKNEIVNLSFKDQKGKLVNNKKRNLLLTNAENFDKIESYVLNPVNNQSLPTIFSQKELAVAFMTLYRLSNADLPEIEKFFIAFGVKQPMQDIQDFHSIIVSLAESEVEVPETKKARQEKQPISDVEKDKGKAAEDDATLDNKE